MKNVILLIALCLIGLKASSQIYKYRCYKDKWIDYNAADDKQMKWQEVNILVVFNLDKLKIRIFAQSEKNLDIIKAYQPFVNSNGDKQTNFECVDESGVKCTGNLITYETTRDDYHIATIALNYADGCFLYRLKDI